MEEYVIISQEEGRYVIWSGKGGFRRIYPRTGAARARSQAKFYKTRGRAKVALSHMRKGVAYRFVAAYKNARICAWSDLWCGDSLDESQWFKREQNDAAPAQGE